MLGSSITPSSAAIVSPARQTWFPEAAAAPSAAQTPHSSPSRIGCSAPGTCAASLDSAASSLVVNHNVHRGGVEVVVDQPISSSNARVQRLPDRPRCAPAARAQSATRSRPSHSPGHAAAPRAAVPAVSAIGRPPRSSVGGRCEAVGSREAAREHSSRGRPPSASRNGEQPCNRRSASEGPVASKRASAGVQSNRKLVRNALEKYCLKGDANRSQREQVLQSFDLERGYERFLILFRSLHTGRHDLRALYGYQDGSWVRTLQTLPSPAVVEARMVAQCLRYDSGGKEFKEVPGLQELNVADAVFLHPQYLARTSRT